MGSYLDHHAVPRRLAKNLGSDAVQHSLESSFSWTTCRYRCRTTLVLTHARGSHTVAPISVPPRTHIAMPSKHDSSLFQQ
eukprot:12417576-Karenia_brevis.AAC.1